jgi:transcriptional regulator with XRE-family HTH domain
MPKAGSYTATPDEWKAALKARLEELGWSYTELAEKIGISRAAVSHIVNSGLASSHVEAIERAVGGLKKKAEQAWKAAEVAAAKEKLAKSPAAPRPAADVAELLSYFQELSPEHKARVVERARTLWEEERGA